MTTLYKKSERRPHVEQPTSRISLLGEPLDSVKDLKGRRVQFYDYSKSFHLYPAWEGTVTYVGSISGADDGLNIKISAKDCVTFTSSGMRRKDSRTIRKSVPMKYGNDQTRFFVLEDRTEWTMPEGEGGELLPKKIDARDIKPGMDILINYGVKVRGTVEKIRFADVPGAFHSLRFSEMSLLSPAYWDVKSSYSFDDNTYVALYANPEPAKPAGDLDKRHMLEAYFRQEWNDRMSKLRGYRVDWGEESLMLVSMTATDLMLELIGD